MTEILLFHHAQGLTAGVVSLAARFQVAGHVVHTPDLYDGQTFSDLDEGVAHARSIGFDVLVERGVRLAEDLPADLVYAGMSMGAMPAQTLAQTRPGARGLLVLHSAVSPADLGGEWPAGLPMQIHTMVDDDWGDADVARQLDEELPDAEVFLYEGDRHLFTDDSLDAYDAEAAAQVEQRALAFLERIA